MNIIRDKKYLVLGSLLSISLIPGIMNANQTEQLQQKDNIQQIKVSYMNHSDEWTSRDILKLHDSINLRPYVNNSINMASYHTSNQLHFKISVPNRHNIFKKHLSKVIYPEQGIKISNNSRPSHTNNGNLNATLQRNGITLAYAF